MSNTKRRHHKTPQYSRRARAHKREKNRNRPCVVDSAEADEMGLLQIWQMTTPEQPTAAEGARERERGKRCGFT